MKLYIKNMVCIRCKMVVKQELEKLDLHYTNVELGEATLLKTCRMSKKTNLKPVC